MYRIVNTRNEVVYNDITSYEEAWEIFEQIKVSHNGSQLEIEEYKTPITGLGRDPDLH